MKKLIVISDWANNELQREYFRTCVLGFLQTGSYPHISFLYDDNSISAGFQLAALVHVEHRLGRPQDTVFFIDAPDYRLPEDVKNQPGQGQFTLLRLASGMYVCGINRGFSFSFIKDQIQHAFTYTATDDISQISERDAHARILSFFMESTEDELELDEIHTSAILETRSKMITFRNGFDTQETNITLDDVKGKVEFGEIITISSHGKTYQVRLCNQEHPPREQELSLVQSSLGMGTFAIQYTPKSLTLEEKLKTYGTISPFEQMFEEAPNKGFIPGVELEF